MYGDLSVVLLANDQPDVLDYEELSDLSGAEFLEEYSTKARPAALEEDSSPQELSFAEDDLLEIDLGEPIHSSTRPSSPVAVKPTPTTPPTSPAPATDDISMEEGSPLPTTAAVQGCDPAVMYVSEEELNELLAKLPHRPLQATIDRWRLRTASPSMKEYIQLIRRDIDAEGPSKFFLPWNLRDTINVKKERKLAQGPYANRKLIIDEYKLKKVRQSWDKLDEADSMNNK